MTKKTIDEELLKQMAAKGFRKRPDMLTTRKNSLSFEPKNNAEQDLETQELSPHAPSIPIGQPSSICQTIEAYQECFLTPVVYTDRCTFSIHRATLTLLKRIVTYSNQPTTVSALVENILRQHLSTYRDLINEATTPNIPKQIIPKL